MLLTETGNFIFHTSFVKNDGHNLHKGPTYLNQQLFLCSNQEPENAAALDSRTMRTDMEKWLIASTIHSYDMMLTSEW